MSRKVKEFCGLGRGSSWGRWLLHIVKDVKKVRDLEKKLGLYLEKYVEMYKKFKRQTSSFYFQIRGSESKGTRWLVLYL
jgi:hypothetical protein